MRAAVASFDAALECESVSVQDSIDVEHWKRKIDLELQKLVEEFEAAEGQKKVFRLSIIDEKINSAISHGEKKNYLKANSLLKEALGLIYDLPKQEQEFNRSTIEALSRSNDSLKLVQNFFQKLIGDGDFLNASSPNNSIPAFRKYLEASALNFDTGVSNSKIALLQEKTFNCLNIPCFALNNNEQTYFTLASFEQLLGDITNAKDNVNSGIKAGKMKYYPGNSLYPNEIKKYADEVYSRHYLAKNLVYFYTGVYYKTYNFEKILFSNNYQSKYLNTYEHVNFGYTATVKDSSTIADENATPQFVLGFFRGRRFIYGLEASMTLSNRPFVTFDSLDFQFTSKPYTYFMNNPPTDTLSRTFKGSFPKVRFQFDALFGYQIPVIRKRKNRHLVLLSVQPMLGPSIRLNGAWKNLESREFVELGNNESSGINYYYSNIRSSTFYLSYNMNLNFRIFRRTYFFLRYGGRLSLTKQKIILSKSDVVREEKDYSNGKFDHDPFDIEIIFNEHEKGLTIGAYTRF